MASLTPAQERGETSLPFENRIVFDNESSNIDTSALIDNTVQSYKPIGTTWLIVLHIFLSIGFLTVIVSLPTVIFHDQCQNQTEPYSKTLTGYDVALYVHAASYLISFAFDRIYRYYHDSSRRDGYLEFYRKTRNLRRAPLLIISTGNAILVCLIKFLEEKTIKVKDYTLCPWYFLSMLTAIEVVSILIVLTKYLALTVRFNRKRARPDATEYSNLSNFLDTNGTVEEIGFRDGNDREHNFEQQADLIRYLYERNDYLSRLLLRTTQDFENERRNRN